MLQAINASHHDQRHEEVIDGLSQLSGNLSSLAGTLGSSIEKGLDRFGEVNSRLPEQKVLVQHSVPRVMTDLVRSQFQLLYDGLKPVLESSALSSKQLDGLRKSIDDCLAQYKALQAEIESAEQE